MNAFKLHGLPTPRPGQVLGLLGSNGIGKSTALGVLSGKLKPNLGNVKDPPDWHEIMAYYRGSDLQTYFTKFLENDLTVAIKVQLDGDYVRKLVGKKVGEVLKQRDQVRRGRGRTHSPGRLPDAASSPQLTHPPTRTTTAHTNTPPTTTPSAAPAERCLICRKNYRER